MFVGPDSLAKRQLGSLRDGTRPILFLTEDVTVAKKKAAKKKTAKKAAPKKKAAKKAAAPKKKAAKKKKK